MDGLVLPLGLILVGLVAIRLGILTFTSIRHAAFQREHEKLTLTLIRERISAAKQRRATTSVAWNGYRKFVVERKVEEAIGICSYYLVPHDHKPLPAFKPGQYLTFRLNIPGREKPVIRCYSLSDSPQTDQYRITVKRVMSPPESPAAPPGLVSNYFHEQIEEGQILDVQAPRGHFYTTPEKERPAVFIAGGVGITPLLSMVNSVAASGSGRELMLYYGVRSGAEHAFKDHLQQIAEQHPNIRVVTAYSQPTGEDVEVEGRDYQHTGRLDVELLQGYLQSTNYEFYICGPASMMESLTQQLTRWGVAKKDIMTEAFGPATVSKAFGQPAATTAMPPPAPTSQVTFAKSGKKFGWNSISENLLDFALSNGVQVESGCRAGNCGTCVVAIKSGEVSYVTEHGADLDEGTCLMCIAKPDGDIVLDA